MRRFTSSWSDSFLARLGYRRTKSRRSYQARRSLFESLEMRAMLSGTQDEGIPLPRPEYVIVSEIRADNQPSDQFVVHTEYAASGTPQAVVTLRDGLTDIDDTLHTLQIELKVGNSVYGRQEVLIDIESQEFRDQFLQDRLTRTRQQVATPHRRDVADWVDSLSTAGEFSDLATMDDSQAAEIARERLEGLAKVVTSDAAVSIDEEKLPNIYAALETQTAELITAKAEVQSADELREVIDAGQSIGRAAILLADQLADDLASSDTSVQAAAEDLQNELAQSGEVYFTVFTGLGANQEVSRETLDDGRVQVFGFLEAGVYEMSPTLRIELGSEQAMVQGTFGPSFAPPASLTTLPPNADTHVVSTEVDQQQHGTDMNLQVGNQGGSTSRGLLAFDLLNERGKLPTSVTLTLNAPTGGRTGTPDQVAAYTKTWTGSMNPAFSDSYTQNNYANTYTGIANGFGPASPLTSAGENAYTADITTAAQRALLLGDSNADGVVTRTDTRGIGLGDVEAFYQAVRNWDSYAGQYRHVQDNGLDNALELTYLIYRNDANWDGVVNTGDITNYFARLNTGKFNFNLDSSTNGTDYSVWSQNYGRIATRYSQGDQNFDGVINDLDVQGFANATHGATIPTPQLLLRVEAAPDSSGIVNYVSKNDNSQPALQPQLALNYPTSDASITQFTGYGSSAGQMEVKYRVPYSNTPFEIAVYQIDAVHPDGVAVGSNSTWNATTPLNGNTTGIGVTRSWQFVPSIITEPTKDYQLVAVMKIGGQEVSRGQLAGGIFKDAGNNWHVWGSPGANTIAAGQYSLSLTGDLTASSVLAGTPINLYVRTLAGYDILSISGDGIGTEAN